ncbi:MAG TPA: HsdR family type I site-specific deoxyribonuclease [Oligoflexia bacterium]|nr:HsdR family type I site-specific deoxyribonuclease [Oligoflexia bacterium]HMR24682.1 HsdR family type I site-specific deoxyribonuclease [Oligoflexia bacterium]
MSQHQAPSYLEDAISQIPALQVLQNLGYTYLTEQEWLKQRKERLNHVLLEDILEKQLKKINRFEYRGQTIEANQSSIQEAVRAIKNVLDEGLVKTNQNVYDLLTLGKSIELRDLGDNRERKNFVFQFIDWEHPENNVFHIADEFVVERTGSTETRRPDIVVFVNGIPLVVIECKRPDLKNPMKQTVSQSIRNQRADQIPKLFHYAQLLMAVSKNEAKYASVGANESFWFVWREEKEEAQRLSNIVNHGLNEAQKEKLFSSRSAKERSYFDAMESEGDRMVTEQDKLLIHMLEPKRLLELVRDFTLFDANVKKIARYQQYFAIQSTLDRISEKIEIGERSGQRRGGVIWHTQGSGKSLTMVMLAKQIALRSNIANPKIIVVTDRVELDQQIEANFKNCDVEVKRASTGKELVKLLKEERSQVITTVINKFDAVLSSNYENPDPNVIVMLDEAHRSQYGLANTKMQKVFPKAAYLGFTGTPLLKKDKNTVDRFGGFISKYTIDEAVKDGAVKPLLYEGRMALQNVDEQALDNWFEKISESLSDEQRIKLKEKFTKADLLHRTDQTIATVAFDISTHFQTQFQGTPYKGQLTVDRKETAIKFKKAFDEFGMVSTEVLISSPDDREDWSDVKEESTSEVKNFWDRMMDQYGNSERYDQQMRSKFKSDGDPEILIVVDKLLTGFDNPKATVLYINRSLKEHNLLQAIARVNRVFEGKDYGLIIDYFGVLGHLDEAMQTYSAFSEFDAEDIQGTITDIQSIIRILPQKHSDLWDVFKRVENKKDIEAFEVILADEPLRDLFRNRLSDYARTLETALSSLVFLEEVGLEKVEKYRNDLKFFENLRRSVMQRYADKDLDYDSYEKRMEKLLDTYVTSSEIKKLTPLVNIFDRKGMLEAIDDAKTDRAKAETILNRTKQTINEKLEEDPTFYRKYSQLIEDLISQYKEKRISDSEYVQQAFHFFDAVAYRKNDDVPKEVAYSTTAQAYYGVAKESIAPYGLDQAKQQEAAIELAKNIDQRIEQEKRVDWTKSTDAQNKMRNAIDLFLIEWQEKSGVSLSTDEMDDIIEKSLDIARNQESND